MRKFNFQPVMALDQYIAALAVMRETALLLTMRGLVLQYEGASTGCKYVAGHHEIELEVGVREVDLAANWTPIVSYLELRRAAPMPHHRRIVELTWSLRGDAPAWHLHVPDVKYQPPWIDAVGCLISGEDRDGYFATLTYARSRIAIAKIVDEFQAAGR